MPKCCSDANDSKTNSMCAVWDKTVKPGEGLRKLKLAWCRMANGQIMLAW